MNKKHQIIFHIVFWIVFISLNFSFIWIDGKAVPLSRYLSIGGKLCVECLDFYFVYLVIAPFVIKQKFSYSAVSIFLLYILCYIIFYAYSLSIIEGEFKIKPQKIFFSISVFYSSLYAIIGFLVRYTFEGIKSTREKEVLQEQKIKSELSLLRSQINPHFLFNTLNNIHSFISNAPSKATDSILKLSQIMRYMLFTSNKEEVSFTEELEYLESYLSLQKIRLQNPDAIHFEIIGEANNLKVPPMLFISFIENAFKHCPNKLNNNELAFTILINATQIIFESKNPFNTFKNKQVSEVSGIGLQNIKKRLDLLYPNNHLLKINNGNNLFSVHLTININK